MKTLTVQLTVLSNPVLGQTTRVALRNVAVFRSLPPKRAEQAWGGAVPSQIHFFAQIEKSAIFITEDWGVTVRSRRLSDCVSDIFTVLNALERDLGMSVTVELIDTHDSARNPLYDQLDRERRMGTYWAIALWVLTIVVSGIVGAMIQRVYMCGGS